ncbi:ATP-binding cassette, subfamily B (MDR/TAP), member 1, partial [Tremellales sp. Uapishka_1]
MSHYRLPSPPPTTFSTPRQSPTPAFSRPPAEEIYSPAERYLPVRNATPSTPKRTPTPRHRTVGSASTLSRAARTALPTSPATPPTSFPYRFEDVELQTIPRESPFHDRHSVLNTMSAVESDSPTLARRQKTMSGYQFAALSPSARQLTFGPELDVADARRSIYPAEPQTRTFESSKPAGPTSTPLPDMPAIAPSFKGLFVLSSPRDLLLHLLPATILAILASLISPYMTVLIGDAFTVFFDFPLVPVDATSAQRSALSSGINSICLKLTIAGVLAAVFNYFQGVLWVWYGESVVSRLRDLVFDRVQVKDMEWFDLGMGMKEKDSENVGAGGLMAKFTRETDDVRIAMGQALGHMVQYTITFLICYILALVKSPVLAIVILSTIPAVVLVQIATQFLVTPLYTTERRAFAEASTNIERATTAISTVKAHNAQTSEKSRFAKLVQDARDSLVKQSVIWGACIGASDFLTLATFVVGFWYGAKVVRDGKANGGDVMTVFWACLLGSSNLQMLVPQLTTLTKGENSMASLMTVIRDPPTNPFSPPATPTLQRMSRTRPSRCRGEFNLSHISFAYPSRPDSLVLRDVSLFLPPGETTFIVGGSGSGKSTVAQLLLRLYQPSGGEITMDEQSFAGMDDGYCRENIAAVQQGCILFDLSIHDNVAMGLAGASGPRRPADVSRIEVEEACKMAMIHDFVTSLPQGYDTMLGSGGNALSGGQKQRLAIARARIRDPVVLILGESDQLCCLTRADAVIYKDEATSALDATSRVLVFESMKQWRKNKTTIVITHDLSQIVSEDFVYVMKDGVVAEQGFRSDLVRRDSIFAEMAIEQAIEPLAPKMEEWVGPEMEEMLDESEEGANPRPTLRAHTPSFGAGLRPASVMYLDILDEYSRGRFSITERPPSRSSWQSDVRRRNSLDVKKRSSLVVPIRRDSRVSLAEATNLVVRQSLRPSSRLSNVHPTLEIHRPSSEMRPSMEAPLDSEGWSSRYEKEHRLTYRQNRTLSENLDHDLKVQVPIPEEIEAPRPVLGAFTLIARYFPLLPSKHLLLLGLLGSLGHGLITPIWSSYVSKLMSLVGDGGTDIPQITEFGCILLALCAAEGAFCAGEHYFLERLTTNWATYMRESAYDSVVRQDKAWFDQSANSPARLVQTLIKDAEDMRPLMSSVIGRFVVFVSMVAFGLIWSLVIGWQLALVGIAIAPVFAVLMIAQTVVMGKVEVKNKRQRELVARTFYESTFKEKFDEDAKLARKTGFQTAWAVAAGRAATSAMPMLAQVPALTKTKVAASDFDRLYSLPATTNESKGELRFPISGNLHFDHVSFAYPTRSDVQILSDLSFSLTPGECVAIVGPSGSGKSTIASLLQRLYEPTHGKIRMDRFTLAQSDIVWLRNHIAVVSQTANLFDASVAENIAYGTHVPIGEIHRAAKAANIHDFIQSLPEGYDTNLGENASLISGGQAQRIQIARALVRRSSILILDECTSALDVDNQRAIVDTILKIKETRTTIFITHSVEAMKRCDRVICLEDGMVGEDGSFEELVRRGGVFAQLMKTGEWE